MLPISAPKKSKRTPNDSGNITPADVLAMLQASLEKVAGTSGFKVKRTNIHGGGELTAAIVVEGAVWNSDGKLVPIANTANMEG